MQVVSISRVHLGSAAETNLNPARLALRKAETRRLKGPRRYREKARLLWGDVTELHDGKNGEKLSVARNAPLIKTE